MAKRILPLRREDFGKENFASLCLYGVALRLLVFAVKISQLRLI
jgi:hypothetical protein